MNQKEQLVQNEIEMRSISEKMKSGALSTDDAQKEFERLKTEKRAIEREIAQANAPTQERSIALADVKSAMTEKRAITLNNTGAMLSIRELWKEMGRKKEILSLVRLFMGPNALTNIPVLSPGLARPAQTAEGATNVAPDTQARLQAKALVPHAFTSVLPVSAETIAMGSVNFEAELPEIFAEAFADGFAAQIVTGSGTGNDFQGIFAPLPPGGKVVNCTASGAPKIQDLVNLALQARDYTDDAVIVMNPLIYSAIISDTTNEVANTYKHELIMNKTIEGVRVVVTGYAPTAAAAGSTVAVAYRPNDYAFGLAAEMKIDPILTPTSTQTYFRAIMFADAARIVDANFIHLRTV